jgi:hypothetical protein
MNECCLVLSTLPHGRLSAHKTGSAQAPKQPVLGRAILDSDCSTTAGAKWGIRSHLIRQRGKRASPLNQDEFRFERWRD